MAEQQAFPGKTTEVREIPIADLIDPWIVQRPVDTSSVDYFNLRDSISKWGLIHPICVRPKSPGKWEIICGRHRKTAHVDVGKSTILCTVRYDILTDADVRNLQIEENANRIEPTLLEYCRQLKKMWRPGMTQRELSQIVHKDSQWVRKVLEMDQLTEESLRAVERGEISLETGYELAKIHANQQPRFLGLALTLGIANFKNEVHTYVKSMREAAKQGNLKKFYTAKFKPIAYVRSPKELKLELATRQWGLLRTVGLTPEEAWYDAIEWVLHLDAASVKSQMNKHEKKTTAKILQREDEPCDNQV